MILKGKTAVVYGAGGALGGTLARAFVRAGAEVHLAGRDLGKLAAEIGAAGAAEVDALDPGSVEAHADALGAFDISANAIGVPHLQGRPLLELSPEEYSVPIAAYTRGTFVTATAAARRMRPGGVILTLSATASEVPAAPTGGFGTACSAVEHLSRQLAAELRPSGVRLVCLRANGISESAYAGSHAKAIWAEFAQRAGVPLEEFLNQPGESLLGENLTLAEFADVALFLVSDQARAMTATVVNVSRGQVIG